MEFDIYLKFYSNYDKAIIASGDGDLRYLVEYLEKQDKLLHIIIPNSRKYSTLLRKYKRYFVYLGRLSVKLSKN